MAQSEKTLEKQLQKHVKSLNGMALKLLPFQFKGLPDRMVLLPGGRVIFVETKSTGDSASKIQIYVHNKIRSLGFTVLIINDKNQIDGII